MQEKHQPLFNTAYLRSVWAEEFKSFADSPEAEVLLARLNNWAVKDWQKETAAEGSFIDIFFKQTWGYHASGEGERDLGYTLQQQYAVKQAGQRGGTGKADIALGYFGCRDMEDIPQVLGEFKDDRSGLDKPQSNRPNDRSPVEQCLDYLREARSGMNSHILPTWGIVTDMNEFRLYLYGNKAQYQRFVISPAKGDPTVSLLADGPDASFQRFVFSKMFHRDWLLSAGGDSMLEKLQGNQIIHEQTLENEFYVEYHAYRQELYHALRQHNPVYEQEGRLKDLVKYAQRILDRCIFIMYCENMGRELNFPPNLLRDVLIETGQSRFYNPKGFTAWSQVKQLFTAMRDGTDFGQERIRRFNGGLFAQDDELDGLLVPDYLFCAQNQGQSIDRILQYPKTLLYFSAKYNFGISDGGKGRTLSLTALGRIFEQSITDLEVMEADAQGRESLAKLTRRKRDGVYYTPEWVTHYIVEETIGARLAEIRNELGFDKFAAITPEQIEAHKKNKRKAPCVAKYEKALTAYRDRLDELKVVDPACGSGAFLIQAFKYLYEQRQWIANERVRITGTKELFDVPSSIRSVLSKNLYGVDINPESVEITRLALWLHTALPGMPLTSLDQNIRCGNSLVGEDFYDQLGIDRKSMSISEQERINAFDWRKAFPDVFDREESGFDCVIGNPPYVKLQHFRKIQEDMARYLLEAQREEGCPLYESTQTGNFDLYLPFIERGVELLNKQGKMGFIAPNVWLVNEYGKGLRQKLKRTKRLDRWVDFKSYQVFDEAITYTALQFFSGSQCSDIRCIFAYNGNQDVAVSKWDEVHDYIDYGGLSSCGSWDFMPTRVRILFDKIDKKCKRLDKSCKGITVGIQTSADFIYHLKKISREKYTHKSNGTLFFEIEDQIMHPLVSGPEAKRYQEPNTSIYLLFPYVLCSKGVRLFTSDEMSTLYPRAWNYLKSKETILRKRENNKMDNDISWWAYNYPKNLNKQEIAKLCVAQLVPGLRVCYDYSGKYYLNNVRVNGIIPFDIQDGWFLLGILNGPVCDYVFKRIAKPKEGGYFEANKQFIAPLPIPVCKESQKNDVAKKSQNLQRLHTIQRDTILKIDARLDSSQVEDDIREIDWLYSRVQSTKDLKKEAPPELKGRDRTLWAKMQYEQSLSRYLDPINAVLRPGIELKVENDDGELKLLGNGVPLIEGIFLDDQEAAFIAAQWRQKIRQTHITEKFDAKKLVNLLLKLRKTSNQAIVDQVVKLDAEIRKLETTIAKAESEMNQLTYELYDLTEEEIRMVEAG